MTILNWLKTHQHKLSPSAQDPQYLAPSDIVTAKAVKFKLNVVKNIWIGAGLSMIAVPLIQWILPVSMLATFLSFMILDETP
ncbi:MAG: hypothetical protein COB51_05265 [Moraxellaceae bacterium]|nr:MAG: hypothetical protein COB51_05265 [Moraxellaceae bacterium]